MPPQRGIQQEPGQRGEREPHAGDRLVTVRAQCPAVQRPRGPQLRPAQHRHRDQRDGGQDDGDEAIFRLRPVAEQPRRCRRPAPAEAFPLSGRPVARPARPPPRRDPAIPGGSASRPRPRWASSSATGNLQAATVRSAGGKPRSSRERHGARTGTSISPSGVAFLRVLGAEKTRTGHPGTVQSSGGYRRSNCGEPNSGHSTPKWWMRSESSSAAPA